MHAALFASWLWAVVGLAGAEVARAAPDAAHAHPAPDAQVLAPGYGRLLYDAPTPGSYTLPVLADAADAAVLRSDGSPTTLHALYAGRVSVLSFVYTRCNDVNGCPLATAVLHRLKARLREEGDLGDRLQLVSLSFDPRNDSPDVMANYGRGFRGPGVPWAFATTPSEAALAPILEAYGQGVQAEYDAEGNELGTLSHLLRVFLIDRQNQIRNIYSVSFLHPDTLLADVRTLLAEGGDPAQRDRASPSGASRDPREGYAEGRYTSHSVGLDARVGRPMDLVAHARTRRPGFARLPEPEDNPLRGDAVALGRRLFFDRRLSHNGTLSCAMCHIPEQGFTNNELATSIGFEGRTVRRNAPSLFDVAYASHLFHDGRESRLEHQVWAPLLAANEMANPSIGAVLERIESTTDYAATFDRVYPGRGVGMETVGMALASYQRTLISGPSPFDRWYFAGERGAMSSAAERGFRLFVGKAGCHHCHTVGAETASFEDGGFHNTGVGFAAAMGPASETQSVLVAPGVRLEVPRSVIAPVSEAREPDLGRYEVTGDPADRWRYKTPGLRNVALSAPYMHDGSLASLEEVVDFYAKGGVPNPGLDPRVRAVALDPRERSDLVAFLQALTGDAVERLISDAWAAPVGERGATAATR